MSRMSIENAALRIFNNENELPSRLAVFALPGDNCYVDVVFADTVATQNDIAAGKRKLLGIFTGAEEIRNIKRQLKLGAQNEN